MHFRCWELKFLRRMSSSGLTRSKYSFGGMHCSWHQHRITFWSITIQGHHLHSCSTRQWFCTGVYVVHQGSWCRFVVERHGKLILCLSNLGWYIFNLMRIRTPFGMHFANLFSELSYIRNHLKAIVEITSTWIAINVYIKSRIGSSKEGVSEVFTVNTEIKLTSIPKSTYFYCAIWETTSCVVEGSPPSNLQRRRALRFIHEFPSNTHAHEREYFESVDWSQFS